VVGPCRMNRNFKTAYSGDSNDAVRPSAGPTCFQGGDDLVQQNLCESSHIPHVEPI